MVNPLGKKEKIERNLLCENNLRSPPSACMNLFIRNLSEIIHWKKLIISLAKAPYLAEVFLSALGTQNQNVWFIQHKEKTLLNLAATGSQRECFSTINLRGTGEKY